MPAPINPARVADLNKVSSNDDAKILINVLTELLNTVTAIATKLDAEAMLSTKTYRSGITLKP